MLRRKPFNFGFSVLMPETNIGLFKSTTNSIRSNYPKASFICVVPKGANKDCFDEIEKVCPIHHARETLASMINVGMKKGHPEWNFFILAGCILPKHIHDKFSIFLESPKDILYPIFAQYDQQGKPTDLHAHFINSTLNGMLVHHDTLKDIGELPEYTEGKTPLEDSRFDWWLDAIDKGYKFKAVLGARVC